MKKVLTGLILAMAAAVAVVWMAPSVASAASGYYGNDGYYNEFSYVDDYGRNIYVNHRGRYFWVDRYGNCNFVPRPRVHVDPHYGHNNHGPKHYGHHNPGLLGFLLGY